MGDCLCACNCLIYNFVKIPYSTLFRRMAIACIRTRDSIITAKDNKELERLQKMEQEGVEIGFCLGNA